MPNSIVKATMREIEPLGVGLCVGDAAHTVIDSGLPALPVVDGDGGFAGIFGEREFMSAIFPGYVETLGSSAMISLSVDQAIERRIECWGEPVSEYMTTDHVLVEDDYSDTQLAELFLHHRVLIIPIATSGRVHAVITRGDFFQMLVKRLDELHGG